MPINAVPDAAGNLAIRLDSHGILHARYLSPDSDLEPGERRGISHFATCPDAPAFRAPAGWTKAHGALCLRCGVITGWRDADGLPHHLPGDSRCRERRGKREAS